MKTPVLALMFLFTLLFFLYPSSFLCSQNRGHGDFEVVDSGNNARVNDGRQWYVQIIGLSLFGDDPFFFSTLYLIKEEFYV